VFNEATYSEEGFRLIQQTQCLGDLVARNVKGGRSILVSMTQPSIPAKPGTQSARAPVFAFLRRLAPQQVAQ
jgi:hypothetical protein